MRREWRWISGSHWVICDICGEKLRSESIKKTWQGYAACPRCWESKHPQLDVKAKIDKIIADDPIRPRPDLLFVNEPGDGICLLTSINATNGDPVSTITMEVLDYSGVMPIQLPIDDPLISIEYRVTDVNNVLYYTFTGVEIGGNLVNLVWPTATCELAPGTYFIKTYLYFGAVIYLTRCVLTLVVT